MKTSRYDLVVVGGGIVGLGAAYAAVKRGLSVLVIERGASATGASIRNFGHLCSGVHSGIAREYALEARELWLHLAHDADFWLRERGSLIVARHADELDLLAAGAHDREITMLDAADVEHASPVARGAAVGGGIVERALQTNPRTALYAITDYLARRGVEFQFRTAVTQVTTGLVTTSRGQVIAGQVVIAVNYDLDQLYPELAEEADVQRCALDMLRVELPLQSEMRNPVLTGWSMLRYQHFAHLPEAETVRARLHSERPELAALDLNQMYTQLPDGSVLVGDTHVRDLVASPFQPECAQQLLLAEAQAMFGTGAPRVIERWQGVYASAEGTGFLAREIEPGVRTLIVTSGNGMTCGLGFAERELQLMF